MELLKSPPAEGKKRASSSLPCGSMCPVAQRALTGHPHTYRRVSGPALIAHAREYFDGLRGCCAACGFVSCLPNVFRNKNERANRRLGIRQRLPGVTRGHLLQIRTMQPGRGDTATCGCGTRVSVAPSAVKVPDTAYRSALRPKRFVQREGSCRSLLG